MKYVLWLLTMLPAAGQCLRYETPVHLKGRLILQDENGYRQYFVFNPEKPICTLATPGDDLTQACDEITDLQVWPTDSEPSDRLERLVSQRVSVQGTLIPHTTGYHRTAVLIEISSVEPMDEAGKRALRVPSAERGPCL